MDGHVFFLPNQKAIMSKTYSKRGGEALGFFSHSCNLEYLQHKFLVLFTV